MTTPFKIVKPSTEAEKATHTTLDTIEVSPNRVKAWKQPPFQRELKVNAKVKIVAEEIQATGVIPGTITIGIFEKQEWLVDGQHRCEAFLLSELPVAYVDVRYMHFGSFAEMGKEFVKLNQQLNRMGPNDILRGLEATSPGLQRIRKKCSYVGYSQIRRGEKGPVVAMSALLRCWFGSATEAPKGGAAGGGSAVDLVDRVTEEEADQLCAFLACAFEAWGRDQAYQKLWSNLNLTLSMWLYRRTVITQHSPQTPKITNEQFRQCLMALSAAPLYIEYLHGRNLTDRDRAPCYARMKNVFAGRLESLLLKKIRLPQPVWSHA